MHIHYTVLYKVFIFIKSALLSKLFGQLYLIFSDNNNLFSDNDASFAAFYNNSSPSFSDNNESICSLCFLTVDKYITHCWAGLL